MKLPDLPEKTLLTPGEVAKFFTVTKQTVYNWCEAGELLCAKPNGVLRIYRSSVISMLKNSDPFAKPKNKRRVRSKGIDI